MPLKPPVARAVVQEGKQTDIVLSGSKADTAARGKAEAVAQARAQKLQVVNRDSDDDDHISIPPVMTPKTLVDDHGSEGLDMEGYEFDPWGKIETDEDKRELELQLKL